MHATMRTAVKSGVALVGAGAIAMSPLVAPPQEIELAASRISSTPVQLTANAFEIYTEAIAQSLTNAAPLVTRLGTLVGPTLSPEFLTFLGRSALENGTALVGLVNPATFAGWVTGIPGAVQSYVGNGLQPFIETVLSNLATMGPVGAQEAFGLLLSGNFEGAVNRLLRIAVDAVGLAPPHWIGLRHGPIPQGIIATAPDRDGSRGRHL